MTWTDLVGPLLVLVALLAIFRIMLRRGGPSPDIGSSGIGGILGSTFLAGLLIAVTLGGSLQALAGGSWLSGATVAAVVALLFAPLSGGRGWAAPAVEVLSALFGVLGLILTITGYFAPQEASCTAEALGLRIAGLALVVVALLAGGIVASFKHIFMPMRFGAMTLAVLGTLEVVEFLSSPLGASVVDLGVTGWIVALGGALAFGFAAFLWPTLVIGVAGVVVALGGVLGGVSGSANASCLPGVDLTALVPLVAYVVVFALLRRVTRRLF